jgi:hypothetical protein
VLAAVVALALASCGGAEENRLFKRLSAEHTGITFSNEVVASDSINVLDFYYSYNGGGVGVGDFNNDGRPDLFFGGNQQRSRLYLNEGALRFRDATDHAGVGADGAWVTGVSVVDINSDGWLDLYLSVVRRPGRDDSANKLLVNQGVKGDGVPTFSEEAAAYGLADTSYSVQALFFDYDKDSDLDLYLLTNGVDMWNQNAMADAPPAEGDHRWADKLYRNMGSADSTGAPRYEDVSDEAGIRHGGYGLGVAAGDLNGDGWPDFYVANDFLPNDRIYLNQQDGTFEEVAAQAQPHQSYSSMGVDLADLNNDLRLDAMVLDMLPSDHERQKRVRASMHYATFLGELEAGYVPQFERNTLQLHRGTDDRGIPHFSDISQLAGVDATGWSWAPLLVDLDNDGFKDLYVTNGFAKDMLDLDFLDEVTNAAVVGSPEAKQERVRALYREARSIDIPNRLFKNNGDLTFSDVTRAWGDELPSRSTGAAYADLDNDGDLDMVVSNVNQNAFVFENMLNRRNEPLEQHYLKVRLRGPAANIDGIGAEVYVFSSEGQQHYYHAPVRGYLSSTNGPVHIGLGAAAVVDSVMVQWGDGRSNTRHTVKANQTLQFNYASAASGSDPHPSKEDSDSFLRVSTERLGLHHKHEENHFNDFIQVSPLLPRMYSRGGPGMAVGDANGKHGVDVFLGGASGHPGTLFLQEEGGGFTKRHINVEDAAYEDMGALFVDVDNDGDQDLYVVSGGSEHRTEDMYQDRLYLNDGTGRFSRSPAAIPNMTSSGSSVVGADFDRDGDIDLFVGGRHAPGAYPTAPDSYLLENEGGRFTDQTQTLAPGLGAVGMVSAAVWSDFNGDGWRDLVVVGEWMPITFFENDRGRLTEVTADTGLENTTGWWNSIYPADIDNDGDMDYVAGNMGTNHGYGDSTPALPLTLFAGDFDENGTVDPVLAHYTRAADGDKKLVPYAGRDDVVEQLSYLKRRYRGYERYATVALTDLIPPEHLARAQKLKATRFETSLVENRGGGTFALHALPTEAQFAPVNGMQAGDFDEDGNVDLILAGNQYASEILHGWHDASLGVYLAGDGSGRFRYVPSEQSGLFLDRDVRSLSMLHTNEGDAVLLVAANTDSLTALSLSDASASCGGWLRAKPNDSYAIIRYRDGSERRKEFHYGAGYLSQSARAILLHDGIASIRTADFEGKERTQTVRAVRHGSSDARCVETAPLPTR